MVINVFGDNQHGNSHNRIQKSKVLHKSIPVHLVWYSTTNSTKKAGLTQIYQKKAAPQKIWPFGKGAKGQRNREAKQMIEEKLGSNQHRGAKRNTSLQKKAQHLAALYQILDTVSIALHCIRSWQQ